MMTQTKIRARYQLGIWGLVAAAFGLVFFLGGGAATYADDSIRMLVAAVILAAGFIGYFSMLYLTREKSNGKALIRDERDVKIARQANEIALVAVLVFVFSVCIALFLGYETAGSLPVGWMWFLAYATGIFGLLAQAVATLTLHREMSGNG
jgi:sterol desaturase/sphingolipid hydroxylase (fatty acid hydroxylase superfamily)